MQQEDFFFFFFFFFKSHPPQRGSYTVAPPNKHFAHSTQMAHQNALIHTPVLSHTTCITSKQNLLSSCPYRRFHFGQFPVFFWGGGGFTHLAPLPPLLLLLFRTWLVHFFKPYHTRFLHFHKSFFPSRATSFTGRQGGRVVFLPLVVISFLSFLPFQPAGSSSSSRWEANPAFLQLKCVCPLLHQEEARLVWYVYSLVCVVVFCCFLCVCCCFFVFFFCFFFGGGGGLFKGIARIRWPRPPWWPGP